jgi:hypothetical protein
MIKKLFFHSVIFKLQCNLYNLNINSELFRLYMNNNQSRFKSPLAILIILNRATVELVQS